MGRAGQCCDWQMSFVLSPVDSTQSPSFPGENVQMSPTLVHVACGSLTFALSATQLASERSAAARRTKTGRSTRSF
jgi:hypothetical protein